MNDTRITNFFPASPKVENQDVVTTIKGKTDLSSLADTTDSLCLSESDPALSSSVLLTPQSSPAKDEKVDDVEIRKPTAIKSMKGSHCKQIAPSEPTTTKTGKKKRGRRRKNGKQPNALSTKQDEAEPQPSRKQPSEVSKPSPAVKQNKLTDYFPVRRSSRKCKSLIQEEKVRDLEETVLSKNEDRLQVIDIDGKGRGVVSLDDLKRGDYVVEYAGDLIDLDRAKKREQKYSEDPGTGCYMYYFSHKNQSYCIDATSESGRMGRLLNHSSRHGNCHTKLIEIKGQPYLILVASQEIKSGVELLYDYGDHSKASVYSHPWLLS